MTTKLSSNTPYDFKFTTTQHSFKDHLPAPQKKTESTGPNTTKKIIASVILCSSIALLAKTYIDSKDRMTECSNLSCYFQNLGNTEESFCLPQMLDFSKIFDSSNQNQANKDQAVQNQDLTALKCYMDSDFSTQSEQGPLLCKTFSSIIYEYTKNNNPVVLNYFLDRLKANPIELNKFIKSFLEKNFKFDSYLELKTFTLNFYDRLEIDSKLIVGKAISENIWEFASDNKLIRSLMRTTFDPSEKLFCADNQLNRRLPLLEVLIAKSSDESRSESIPIIFARLLKNFKDFKTSYNSYKFHKKTTSMLLNHFRNEIDAGSASARKFIQDFFTYYFRFVSSEKLEEFCETFFQSDLELINNLKTNNESLLSFALNNSPKLVEILFAKGISWSSLSSEEVYKFAKTAIMSNGELSENNIFKFYDSLKTSSKHAIARTISENIEDFVSNTPLLESLDKTTFDPNKKIYTYVEKDSRFLSLIEIAVAMDKPNFIVTLTKHLKKLNLNQKLSDGSNLLHWAYLIAGKEELEKSSYFFIEAPSDETYYENDFVNFLVENGLNPCGEDDDGLMPEEYPQAIRNSIYNTHSEKKDSTSTTQTSLKEELTSEERIFNNRFKLLMQDILFNLEGEYKSELIDMLQSELIKYYRALVDFKEINIDQDKLELLEDLVVENEKNIFNVKENKINNEFLAELCKEKLNIDLYGKAQQSSEEQAQTDLIDEDCSIKTVEKLKAGSFEDLISSRCFKPMESSDNARNFLELLKIDTSKIKVDYRRAYALMCAANKAKSYDRLCAKTVRAYHPDKTTPHLKSAGKASSYFQKVKDICVYYILETIQ